MSVPVKCSKRVRGLGMSMHFRECHCAGTVEREGKMYCGIHDPVAVKARRDRRDAKWDAARAADRARWAEDEVRRARADLCVAACAGLSDGDLKRLTEFNRCDIMAFIAKQI